ncbi:MAG: hypothetical protein J7D61_16030 [Marichromatium sp.]|nr:hypothetical protein [Marichromatium sp.]
MQMFEILDSSIKYYNPIMDLYLYTLQYLNGWIGLIIFIFASIGAMFYIFKKSKILFLILLPIFLYGYLGIFSLTYFDLNYDSFETNVPKTLKRDIVGSWCKGENSINLNADNKATINIDNTVTNGTWSINRALMKISIDNKTHIEARIVKFGKDLFLSVSQTTQGLYGYQVLEYRRCD